MHLSYLTRLFDNPGRLARFALIMILISTATSLTTFKKAVDDFIKQETEQKMNVSHRKSKQLAIDIITIDDVEWILE